MATHRRLDDPSHGGATLLTLPLTDFPGTSAPAAGPAGDDTEGHSGVADTDGLILVRLPPAGGLSVADLTSGRAYILGDTSEADVRDSLAAAPSVHEPSGGGSIAPVAARLLVEGDGTHEGKTLELTRVETSNTYVVVPPLPLTSQGGNKRQKLDEVDSAPHEKGKMTATMPARSVGLVPGEESPSCFFLDPRCLSRGHFSSALRGCLARWTYDPFAPPAESTDKAPHKDGGGIVFGYTVAELAHICRTSRSEMERAVGSRAFGAEEALALPSSDKAVPVRYGTLSEEGRQTVGAAIVTTLLETDLELAWEGGPTGVGTEVGPLVDEVRATWHRLEGEERAPEAPHLTDSREQQEAGSQAESQSQFGTPSQLPAAPSAPLRLADDVVWHCLRPLVHCKGASTKDDMPERVRLVPDRVAELAAHHVFLRSTPPPSHSGSIDLRRGGNVWEESALLEAWATRLPSMPKGYEPRVELLRGIAVAETEESVDGEEANLRLWRYLPEAGLPLLPAPRIQAMLAMRDAWTLEEAAPYLQKFIVGGNTDGKEGQSQMAALLGKHARAISVADKGTVYVAKQK